MKPLAKYSALLAFLLACIPPFFFSTPLFLKSMGSDNGFYGIAFWAASILGGFAFMHGLPFTQQVEKPLTRDNNVRTAVGAISGIFLAVLYSHFFKGNYPVITSTRPDFLLWGILIFMGMRGLEGLYIHGILQGEMFASLARPARVFTALFMAGTLSIGFLLHDIDSTTLPYFSANIIESALGILLFELGLPLYAVVFTRMLGGAVFIWFMQLYLF